MSTYVPVVDCSQWQGEINFAELVEDGVQGVILRAFGAKTDLNVGLYMPHAKAVGLKRGLYPFVNPTLDRTGREMAERLVRQGESLGGVELPYMLDVESFSGQPQGPFPALRGPAYRDWLQDATDTLTRLHRAPIMYTGASYWNSYIGHAGELGKLDVILARYPIYPRARKTGETEAVYGQYMEAWLKTSPKPPKDARGWADWIMNVTTSRPVLPAGWDKWAGWQFSAGYNRMGHVYEVGSDDLDLDIITEEAWNRWCPAPAVAVEVAPVVSPVIVHPTAPTWVTAHEEENPLQFIAKSPNNGMALCTYVQTTDNTTRMRMTGIEGDLANIVNIDLAGRAPCPVIDWDDATYLARASQAFRG